MNRLRDHFLAGPALTGDQHRHFGWGDALDQRAQFYDRGMVPDQDPLDRKRSLGLRAFRLERHPLSRSATGDEESPHCR
jgi:hypothetical protein